MWEQIHTMFDLQNKLNLFYIRNTFYKTKGNKCQQQNVLIQIVDNYFKGDKMTCFKLKNGETARQFCLRNNLCYAIFYKLVESGLTTDEACNITLKRKGCKAGREPKFFYKGKPLIQTIKSNSKDYNRIINRIRKGFTVEQAVELPLIKSGPKKKG